MPSAVAGVLSGETWRSGVLRLHQRAVARAWFAARTEVRPAPSNPLPLGALGLSAARQNIHAQRMAAAAQRIENNMRRALVIVSTFRHLLFSSHCLVVSCINSAHLPTQQTYLTTTTTPLTPTTTTIVIAIHAHPLHLHHNYVNNHNHHTHNNVYKFLRKIYNT